MNKFKALGSAAIFAAVSSVAFAGETKLPVQGMELIPANSTLRFTVFFPEDSTMRDRHSVWYGLAYEFIPSTQFLSGSETFFSGEFYAGGTNLKNWAIPLTVNQRFWAGAGGANQMRTYFFAGAGLFFFDIGGSTTTFGVRGGIGMELSDRFSAELVGYLSGKGSNTGRMSGIGVSFGSRF